MGVAGSPSWSYPHPFYGVLFFFLWFTPAGEASMANAIYIFIVLELFFLASTLGAGPYEALLPEIARSHRERVSVVAWQFYFGVLGAALGLSLSGLIQDAFGFKVMGAVMAVAAVSFRYLATGGIWRHAPRDTPPARTSFGEAFKATLRNVQFLYFIPTFLFFNLAVNMVIAWLPFFSSALISSESSGSSTAAITFTALVSMTISAFVLWKLCNSLGKARIYSACLLGTALVFPLLFFTGMAPGVPTLYQALFIAVLAGFPMAGVNLLPRAITADITDYDEIRTGMRREGMFFAVQNLFEKAGSSLAPFLLALILLLGETAEDPWGIRLLGPAAGLIAFLGFWLFRGYRLPSTVTRETLKAAGLDAGPEEPERSQEDQRP